jgi:hypothetical protein
MNVVETAACHDVSRDEISIRAICPINLERSEEAVVLKKNCGRVSPLQPRSWVLI